MQKMELQPVAISVKNNVFRHKKVSNKSFNHQFRMEKENEILKKEGT